MLHSKALLTRAANSAKEMSPLLSQSYLLSQVLTSSSDIQLCMQALPSGAGHIQCGSFDCCTDADDNASPCWPCQLMCETGLTGCLEMVSAPLSVLCNRILSSFLSMTPSLREKDTMSESHALDMSSSTLQGEITSLTR